MKIFLYEKKMNQNHFERFLKMKLIICTSRISMLLFVAGFVRSRMMMVDNKADEIMLRCRRIKKWLEW